MAQTAKTNVPRLVTLLLALVRCVVNGTHHALLDGWAFSPREWTRGRACGTVPPACGRSNATPDVWGWGPGRSGGRRV
jgi:hypothetical protein